MNDKRQQKVEDLVCTRINGNNIKTYPVYVAMIKSITKADIREYSNTWCNGLTEKLYGTKIDMIEQIKNHIIRG